MKEYDSMKWWNRVINCIMIGAVSVTVVRLIVDYVDLMILRPEVYAIRSAPWYIGGLVYGAITLVLLLVCIVIKAIIKHNQKKK